MISDGWTDDEIVNNYKPRFLHSLNALSECKQDKPVSTPGVVDMMDKPLAFNPTNYRTIGGSEADTILSQIMRELMEEKYLSKHGASLFATKAGLEMRKATDLYWKRTSNEKYDCDEDKPRLGPS